MTVPRASRFLFASALALLVAPAFVACGSTLKAPNEGESVDGGGGGGGGGGGDGSSPGFDSGPGITFEASLDTTSPTPPSGDGGVPCPAGTTCNVTCTGGATTTLSGIVKDPAGKNPLYNIVVYIPATTPEALPTGASCDSCNALFSGTPIAVATTDESGKFTMTKVPATGDSVPLVVQVGKWRTQTTVKINSCADNDAGTLKLPSKQGPGADLPNIAVSTGSADSLECLLMRIGVDPSEYTAGAGGSGHIHIFNGGNSSGGGFGGGGGGGAGKAEKNPMSGAPASPTSLWASKADLMAFDLVLLSCEGGETYNAVPQNLEDYLNAGGRVFGSHFHYAWFSGPLDSGQSYSAPGDWGTNLATWQAGTGGGGGLGGGAIGGQIITTLSGGGTFNKGKSLDTWLGNVGALGTDGVASGELAVYQPKHNADVSASNKPSQPWITADSSSGMAGATLYFSFDTPINAPVDADSGVPNYCGRAVFSDLHVGGAPSTTDSVNGGGGFGGTGGSPPPSGCANVDLSAQEKALEFMLFDLSSCVIPDSVKPTPPPVDDGGGIH